MMHHALGIMLIIIAATVVTIDLFTYKKEREKSRHERVMDNLESSLENLKYSNEKLKKLIEDRDQHINKVKDERNEK